MPSDKEVAQLFFSIKGHITNISVMRACYDGYFRRAWSNEENWYTTDWDKFERLWNKKN